MKKLSIDQLMISGRNLYLSCLTALLLLLTPAAQADNTQTLGEIAQTLLKLQQEIIATERLLNAPLEGDILTIYLDVADIPQLKLESLKISLNDNQVLELTYNERQNRAFAKGGIQKIFHAPVEPGEYQLKAEFFASISDPVFDSKMFRFTKGPDNETLTITIIDALKSEEPQMVFFLDGSIKE